MKKNIISIFCIALAPLFVAAQAVQTVADSTQYKSLLFAKFYDGVVLMKTGAVEKAPLNYNSNDQSVVFQKGDEILTLTNLSAIDTIFILDRKFVNVENKVYEIATGTGNYPLYISYANKIRPNTATVDQNGGSRKTNGEVSNTVSGAYTNKVFRNDNSVEIVPTFYLRKSRYLFKVNNVKNIEEAFPSKDKELIKSFAKDNNIDFKNQDDLLKIIAFCVNK
ncbi:MAG: hypothetical protein QM731_12955 [Chitinophagaceae bacterium]